MVRPSEKDHQRTKTVYLLEITHPPSIVKEQFSKAKKETRSEVRQKQTKQDKMSVLNLLIPITLHGLTFTISSKIMDLYYTLIKI